jgi:hypothetical protein
VAQSAIADRLGSVWALLAIVTLLLARWRGELKSFAPIAVLILAYLRGLAELRRSPKAIHHPTRD